MGKAYANGPGKRSRANEYENRERLTLDPDSLAGRCVVVPIHTTRERPRTTCALTNRARLHGNDATASRMALSPKEESFRARPVVFPVFLLCVFAGLLFAPITQGQLLINVDFGVGTHSAKLGPAATGLASNDFWNLYRHYEPKFTPGMPLVSDGTLKDLKQADGAVAAVSISVSNAPGVWGNATGDAMYDSYIFSQNGSNITVAVQNLKPGRYHFYLYGHADADVILATSAKASPKAMSRPPPMI
ncbi:MAG: hypothetical protein L0Y58_17625 [Verrucomicrobia subdivision 3 bacterium]|nr:hypothetical protein [Limisphaerales bacterium]